MRILLLLERVSLSSECAPLSLDDEGLVSLAEAHDLVVAVDENTPGASVARDAGITVHVSDKRHVHMPDGAQVDADAALANWVAARHEEVPFDLVVASSDRPPFGSVRDAVPRTPWGTLAASGPTALAGRLQMDSDWLDAHGLQLWRAASHLRAADVVLSPVRPDLLGLDVGDRPTASLLPTPEPQWADRVGGDLVVIAATSVSRPNATWMLEAALDRISHQAATTLVVLCTPALHGEDDVLPALAAGLPDDLATRTVLAPVGRHEDAGDWLAAADALVLCGPGELVVPAVARRSEVVPTVLVGGAAEWRTPVLTAPPVLAPSGDVELLTWTNAAAAAADLRARRRRPGADAVVVHTPAAAEEAARWRGLRDIDRFDVVVGALPRPPWASPRLGMLAVDVVCLRRQVWNVAADALDTSPDLTDLIARLADPAGLRTHTLGAVAVAHDPPTTVRPRPLHPPLQLLSGPLPSARPPLPVLAPPASPAPAPAPDPDPEPEPTPAESVHAWAKTSRWSDRTRIARPWRLGLRRAIQRGDLPDGVAQWAKQHTITDRARLLLPWRWGLLPRAMEDRW